MHNHFTKYPIDVLNLLRCNPNGQDIKNRKKFFFLVVKYIDNLTINSFLVQSDVAKKIQPPNVSALFTYSSMNRSFNNNLFIFLDKALFFKVNQRGNLTPLTLYFFKVVMQIQHLHFSAFIFCSNEFEKGTTNVSTATQFFSSQRHLGLKYTLILITTKRVRF